MQALHSLQPNKANERNRVYPKTCADVVVVGVTRLVKLAAEL